MQDECTPHRDRELGLGVSRPPGGGVTSGGAKGGGSGVWPPPAATLGPLACACQPPGAKWCAGPWRAGARPSAAPPVLHACQHTLFSIHAKLSTVPIFLWPIFLTLCTPPLPPPSNYAATQAAHLTAAARRLRSAPPYKESSTLVLPGAQSLASSRRATREKEHSWRPQTRRRRSTAACPAARG